MLAASRRGRLHAHEGTFREDAFCISVAGNWCLIAVADGAGSCPLSRVGANLAAQTAVKMMADNLSKAPHNRATVRKVLQGALEAAWHRLAQETENRKEQGLRFRDLSTTLLLLAFHARQNLIGVAQIGDGLLAGQLADGTIQLLGEPDTGTYAGQTHFLTSYPCEALATKIDTPELRCQPRLFFVMTDGLSDDLYPPLKRLPGLIKPIPHVLQQDRPEQALLELLAYDRVGSFDDRTLVVLCQRQKCQLT